MWRMTTTRSVGKGLARPVAALVVPVVAGLLLVGAAAAQDDGVQCGDVITVDTALTHNLRGCETGLTVEGPVTLDLKGHSITGQGVGVGVDLRLGATVKSGAIRGFDVGVSGFGVGQTVSDLNISDNRAGISVAGTNSTGNSHWRIENNTIHDNTDDGIFGMYPFRQSTLIGNRVVDNGGNGMRIFGASGVLFEGNTVSGNGGHGIHWFYGSGHVFENTLSRNGGTGLVITETCGNFINGYRIGDNEANHNGLHGISITHGCTPPISPLVDLADAGGNVAKGNGAPEQCVDPTIITCFKNDGQADRSATVGDSPLQPEITDSVERR
jgi:parallel beta-helix repeat protein